MDGVVMDFLLSDAIFGELRKQFGESRAAHAFLLECPDAYLRRDALRLLSAFAVCRDGGCLVCPDCRRALKGVHCDVKFLPFDAEKGKITVADTDKLIEDVPLRPLNAKNKAYLLDASLSAGREEWQNKKRKFSTRFARAALTKKPRVLLRAFAAGSFPRRLQLRKTRNSSIPRVLQSIFSQGLKTPKKLRRLLRS